MGQRIKTVEVNLGDRSYKILINASIPEIGEAIIDKNFTEKILIITNPTVNKLYGGIVKESLERSGFRPIITEIPDGEEYKTIDTVNGLYKVCIDNYLERLSPIIALGGGVIGDIAGFVAATYLRGVPLIMIPTTLLAQVDSSIGGKVGVNHPKSKNLIGAFYQPALVYIDTNCLKTLPYDEFKNGFAEVIKYGVIADRRFFKNLERDIKRIKEYATDRLEYIVWRSCQIKAWVVKRDEKEETGIRSVLNFGHTVGHAIEAVTDYKFYKHGEAVGLGMISASKIAVKMNLLKTMWARRIEHLINRAGLPTKIKTDISIDEIIERMHFDKKVKDERVRFVLPDGRPGRTTIRDDVPEEIIREVVENQKES